jgi:hypothetical protein
MIPLEGENVIPSHMYTKQKRKAREEIRQGDGYCAYKTKKGRQERFTSPCFPLVNNCCRACEIEKEGKR